MAPAVTHAEAAPEETGAAAALGAPDAAAEAQTEAEAIAPEGQAGAGEELEEEAAQGGGAQGAAVSAARKYRSHHVVTDPSTGRISKVTFYFQGDHASVRKRPPDGHADAVLWTFMDAQYKLAKRGKRDKEALDEVERLLQERRRCLTGTAPSPAPAAALAPAPAPAPAAAAAPFLAYNFRSMTNVLRPAVQAEIERRYFLTIVEDTHSVDGREFAPKGKSGSICGSFPHMVINPGHLKGSQECVYGCSQAHRVGVRVQLMERKPDGGTAKASEHELLKLLSAQFDPTDLEKHGHFEKTLTIYVSLELSPPYNHGPVQPASFVHPPPGDALWSPPESPPYHGGSTERVMEGGFVQFRKIWFNKSVTSPNLKSGASGKSAFRIKVHTLNPILHSLKGFTAQSSEFVIKSCLHNDVTRKECFVRNPDGQVVPLATPAAEPK